MLVRLLWRDLRSRLGLFALFGGCGLVLVVLLVSKVSPTVAIPFVTVWVVSAHYSRMAGDDDRAGMLLFLKVLPVSPKVTVSVHYLSGIVAATVYAGLFTAAARLSVRFFYPQPLAPYSAVLAVLTGVTLCLALMALINALYFRLGYQNIEKAMVVIIFAIFAAGIGKGTWLLGVAVNAVRAIREPILVALAGLALASALVLLSWGYSVSSLAKREFF